MGSCNCIPKKVGEEELQTQRGGSEHQIMDKEKQQDAQSFTHEDNKPANDESQQLVQSTKGIRKKLPRINMLNGGYYEGEWFNCMRDGFGLHNWADGGLYEGEWKNDKAEGKGKLVHGDGDVLLNQTLMFNLSVYLASSLILGNIFQTHFCVFLRIQI